MDLGCPARQLAEAAGINSGHQEKWAQAADPGLGQAAASPVARRSAEPSLAGPAAAPATAAAAADTLSSSGVPVVESETCTT